jgi:valyl-tRNA synthetase
LTDLLKATELPPTFDPVTVEAGLYEWWDKQGYFQPSNDPDAEPFVIIMPPPNVTGELHVGHALFVGLQDLMIRWNRGAMGRRKAAGHRGFDAPRPRT